jgi:3-oxoacyl-[acyl-carrier-protein] synthase II
MHRVAVTGWGVVSPWGNDPDIFQQAILNSHSAVRALEDRADGPWPNRPAAWIEQFNPRDHFTLSQLSTLDRASQFALVASRSALQMAAANRQQLNLEQCGVYVGTGMGSAGSMEATYHSFFAEQSRRLKPLTIPSSMANAAAAHIVIETQFTGPNVTFCSACASSAIAIGEAARKIRYGEASLMVAGGVEALIYPSVLHAWEALRTLAEPDPLSISRSCKPFSKNRTGMVLGEGAAFFVLEAWDHAQSRGAEILAELKGFASTSDSVHLTKPSVAGQAHAMCAALKDANLQPQEIGYINAHGTGTQANDSTEAAAIREVFGTHAATLPVSSTKAVHGHLLGGASALELLITLKSLRDGRVPPTANLDQIDPECVLDHVLVQSRETPNLRYAMSNSFAFGGTSGVLIAAAVP